MIDSGSPKIRSGSMKKFGIYLLCALLPASAGWGADAEALRGYSASSSQTEREWEAKFRALPDAGNQRAYMQRLAARPHHVGSAYDKEDAEWILSQFQQWGLDAKIETFDVLFPTPKERALELVAPARFTAKLRSLPFPRTRPPRNSTNNSPAITHIRWT